MAKLDELAGRFIELVENVPEAIVGLRGIIDYIEYYLERELTRLELANNA